MAESAMTLLGGWDRWWRGGASRIRACSVGVSGVKADYAAGVPGQNSIQGR